MSMASFAYYRLPYADRYTVMVQTEGEPERLASCTGLNGRNGFVLAPFSVSSGCPVLLIHPDRVEERAVPEEEHIRTGHCTASRQAGGSASGVSGMDSDKAVYSKDFESCRSMLVSGEFSKIVLARSAGVETVDEMDAEGLFLRACRMYPRMFVVLVSTPQSGMWLAATPEILLESSCGTGRTVALAGTMKLDESQLGFDYPPSASVDDAASGIFWSTKNIKEQRYVATYISDVLKRFAGACREEGPRTVRAGNIVHLRSDFTFELADTSRIGSLLDILHPTPAVCGLPKTETYRHIVDHEHTDRRYYSGFMGPLCHDGATHLYVSLRCMQIVDGRHYRLYAGGGLLKDSVEEQEWCETEAKMETMLRLFDGSCL